MLVIDRELHYDGGVSDRAPIREALRKQLHHRLALKGATQGELAAFLGKSSAWISQVLTGRRGCRFDVIDQMAEFFGVPPYLLFIDPAISDSDARLPRPATEGGSVDDPAPRVSAPDPTTEALHDLIAHQQHIIQVLADTQFILAKDNGPSIRDLNVNIGIFGAQLDLLTRTISSAVSPDLVDQPHREGKPAARPRRRAAGTR